MALPRNGFVQPVEVIAGGPLPRNGFVQPVEVVGGAPSSATPVAGGSGQFYASITAALAGEVQTVVSGLVPQAGTQAGVIVGPGTLSPVDDFYKDMFILNTSPAPSNGLVAQWARVASYVGATRTFTIDKPWDFSAEASFEVIGPVRIMVFLDILEDVNVNKNLMLDLMGNRLKGKVDISSADFCWIRGASGFVTNGIQKTDFGLLKIDDCFVSRRDATIYALLLTDGNNLGRGDFFNCQFAGRVAGRRGKSGWFIKNCSNMGVPNSTADDDVPYTLVESVGAVSIALTQLDVTLDTSFCGSLIYSENSVTGATVYLSVSGEIRFTEDFSANASTAGVEWTPRKYSIVKVVGAGIATITVTQGWYELATVGLRGAISVSGQTIPVSSFLMARNCTSTSQLLLSGAIFEASFTGFTLFRGLQTEGSSNMSGSLTLGGTSTKRIDLSGGCNGAMAEFNGPVTGTVTVSGGVWTAFGGSRFGHLDVDVFQSAGAPTITFSAIIESRYNSQFVTGVNTSKIGVGTWAISGAILVRHSDITAIIESDATGGVMNVSSQVDVVLSATSSIGAIGAGFLAAHVGTGGTLTVSGNAYMSGGRFITFSICRSFIAGGTINVTSASVRLDGVSVQNATSLLVASDTATSTATLTGTIIIFNCHFESAVTLITATAAGGVATGPIAVTFEMCVWESTLTERSGAGTITWGAGATFSIKHCHIEGLFTFVGTPFTTVEAFYSRFNGNASNKAITVTGARPTTYRLWKCSTAARYDDFQPEVLYVYDILPAQAALVQGQPVKINAANQYQVCVAASVVDGAILAAAGGAGTIVIAIRQGRAYVKVNAAVANGDNLVLDTVTPTQAVTAAAVVVGQGIGTALEAAGATLAGLAYTAINVR